MEIPFTSKLSAVTGLASAAAELPLLGPLGRLISNIESMTAGMGSIHEQFVAMRGDIATLDVHVQELHAEVASMTGAVKGIRSATENLDVRVDSVSESLESLDAVVGRFGRRGRRRAERASEAAEKVAAASS